MGITVMSQQQANDSLVKIGKAQAIYTATGKQTGLRVEIWHNGLNEYRLLRAPELSTLQNKVSIQLAAWTQKWERVSSKNAAQKTRLQGKDEAEQRTNDAQHALTEASQLLGQSFSSTRMIRALLPAMKLSIT